MGRLQTAYRRLCESVKAQYGAALTPTGNLGISAMMHGYLPFDGTGKQLTPFRTWRTTSTTQAAAALTELLGFSIPLRWSAAHLYQAILNGESHVQAIDYLATLAGYIHWQLTGENVLGLEDVSGIFSVDSATGDYHTLMMRQFDALLLANGLPYTLRDISRPAMNKTPLPPRYSCRAKALFFAPKRPPHACGCAFFAVYAPKNAFRAKIPRPSFAPAMLFSGGARHEKEKKAAACGATQHRLHFPPDLAGGQGPHGALGACGALRRCHAVFRHLSA